MRQLQPHQLMILRHVADNGPISCIQIMNDLRLERKLVYPFLYKCRCYDGGKGWIDNAKVMPDVIDETYSRACAAPGEYTITQEGREELARQEAARGVLS